MPRFFFHVLNDASFLKDEEGQELQNLEAACKEARRAIGEIIAQEVMAELNSVHLSVMIDDETGTRVANIKAVTHIVFSVSPFSE
ncbi:MAG: hypothetical protein ABIO86_00215 [Sphingomonas sp.]